MNLRDVVKKLEAMEGMGLSAQRVFTTCMLGLQRSVCPSCWMTRRACICAKLRPVRLKHRVLLYLHNKEFGKAVNTGKLVVRATQLAASVWDRQHSQAGPGDLDFGHLSTDIAGDGEGRPVVSEVFIFDVAEQEAELLRILEEEADRTVVLYPSSTAVQASEFFTSRLAQQNQRAGVRAEEAAAAGGTPWDQLEPQNIVLIDGTWTGVHAMHRRIPKNIPRVVIPLPEDGDGGEM